MNEFIEIKNARTNNLKNVNLKIPLNQITCISGPSGSGKSSLAFHTVYAESKRRFMNSLPNSFRFFSEKPAKADVDKIFPVLPAWVLPQNNPILSSRQSVADLLDISRVSLKLFTLEGEQCCPEHKTKLEKLSINERLKSFVQSKGLTSSRAVHFFIKKTDYQNVFETSLVPSRSIKTKKSKIGEYSDNDNYLEIFRIKPQKINTIEDRLKELGQGMKGVNIIVRFEGSSDVLELDSSASFQCSDCDYQVENKHKSLDQINIFSPLGACPACKGYGSTHIYDRKKMIKDPSLTVEEGAISIVESAHFDYFSPMLRRELKKNGIPLDVPFKKLPAKVWKILYDGSGDYPGFNSFFAYLERKKYKKTVRIYKNRIQTEIECPKCEGSRIRVENHFVGLCGKRKKIFLQDYFLSHVEELAELLTKFELPGKSIEKVQILNALEIAMDLGIGYLPLDRKVKTLSASEYQRALLVKYFLFKGSGSLFVFDEPSLGLRVEEQKMILKYMRKLRTHKNTVLLVDHSDYFQNNADHIVGIGPGAGPYGGDITYEGSPEKQRKPKKPKFEKSAKAKSYVKVSEVEFFGQDLKELEIPKERLTCVIGAPGVGKTKIFMDGLPAVLAEKLDDEQNTSSVKIKKISGINGFEGYHSIDGYSLKSNSRSSVGTYLEILPEFRKFYAGLKASKALALEAGHFSPNSAKGKCLTCEGRGTLEADMKYFETVQYKCPDCSGLKLKPMYANISNGTYKFHEIVSLPLVEVYEEIGFSRKLSRIMTVLENFKLSYLSMNRSLTSLSGGERQRLKLAKFFLRERTKHLLILENISFGLSLYELDHITSFLRQFCSNQNTVLIVDPNPIVAHYADNILELKKKGTSITSSLT